MPRCSIRLRSLTSLTECVVISPARPCVGGAVRTFVAASFRREQRASPYEHGIHRSDAEALINKVPVIEVAGHVAVCDGGGGALGHPVEFIQLDNVSKAPAICKYCGLRFKMKAGGHHH